MKKLLTLCLSLFLSSFLLAQVQIVAPGIENEEVHANKVAKELAQLLSLDQTQIKHVVKISKEANTTYGEITYLQQSNPELYGKKLESLTQHTDALILQILNPEQQISYKGIIIERIAALKQKQVKQNRLQQLENQ